MTEYYYYTPCPLCQQDVDESRLDYYRVLPLDHTKAALINEKPMWEPGIFSEITVGGLSFTRHRDYPGLRQRAWLLHKRCISLVRSLPLSKLHLLLDLVESTFLSRSNPPMSEHGAFYYSQPIQQNPIPMPDNIDGSRLHTISNKKQTDGPSLPLEIWDMVLRYDISRLVFIMKTASSLARGNIFSVNIPSTRFIVETLDLQSPIIQIHLIDIGGRLYICNLSNPANGDNQNNTFDCDQNNTRHYLLNGGNYLAVKSDGVGVLDIAFEEEKGHPNWLLNNSTQPFVKQISQIRDAKLQSLRFIHDVWVFLYSII